MEINTLSFYIISAVVITLALLAVTTVNLVRAALALAFCFFALAGIFWILGSPFIAVLQLVVNAGAIPIITIFIVMMTHSNYSPNTHLAILWILPVSILFCLAAMIFFLSPNTANLQVTPLSTEQLGIELLSIRGREVKMANGDLFLVQGGSIVAFELTALVLLVAFVGAIILAKKN